MDDHRFGPVRFAIHFVFGAILGAFLGLMSWKDSSVYSGFPWEAVIGGAVLFGLLAGWLGDRFWGWIFGTRP